MAEEKRHLGKVKWFNPRSGFGFVTRVDDDSDVFVHHSGLMPNNECFKTLYTGEYVEMDITTDEHGKHFASNVRGPKGGDLMCERYVKSERERPERSERPDRTERRPRQNGGGWSTQGRRGRPNQNQGRSRQSNQSHERED